MFSSILLSFACILALYFLISKIFGFGRSSSTLPLPPGPYGLPILGYLPFFGKQPHHVLTNLGKKYGSVFRISMGKYQGVVLHDWKAVKAALIDQGEIFAGRPVLDHIVKEVGGRYGIIGTDGRTWKEQRRFSIGQLKDLGFGKRVMELAIESELDDFIACLEKHGKAGMDVQEFLFVPLLNVIWSIIAGKRFSYDDVTLPKFKNLVRDFVVLSGIQDFLFMPNFLIKMGYRRSLRQKRSAVSIELLDHMTKEIENHKRVFSEEEQRDFMDSYLNEINKHHKMSSGEDTTFSEQQLRSISLNFFLAGVETTASTLGWFCLYIAVWPEVQEKIIKELDAVLGDRAPILSDRPMLPYTNAAIMEVQRMASIVPFSIAHRNLKSTTLLGYHIPKDCVIIPNLWNVCHDPDIWGDPENFRPERFLNEEGNVIKPDYFLPFSAGPRICLGESLAKMELFIFVTNILHRFTIKLPEGSKKPDMTVKFGLTLAAPKNTLLIEKRAD